MPSFDVVSKIDMQEVDNALNQAQREVGTRYDLKDSGASIANDEKQITIQAPDKMKVQAVLEIVKQKLAKRGVGLKSLRPGEPQEVGGGQVRQAIELIQGIASDKAKKIVKFIKDKKLKKVQVSVQGEELRVTGPKRDDLQTVIGLLKEEVTDQELQFVNFRD